MHSQVTIKGCDHKIYSRAKCSSGQKMEFNLINQSAANRDWSGSCSHLNEFSLPTHFFFSWLLLGGLINYDRAFQAAQSRTGQIYEQPKGAAEEKLHNIFSAFNRRTLSLIIAINCIKRRAEVQCCLVIVFQSKLQKQKEAVQIQKAFENELAGKS